MMVLYVVAGLVAMLVYGYLFVRSCSVAYFRSKIEYQVKFMSSFSPETGE